MSKSLCIYITALFLFIISCTNSSHKQASETVTNKNDKKSVKDTTTAKHKLYDSSVDTGIVSKKINYNLYSFKNLSLNGSFNADSALKALYPGNYYKYWIEQNDSVAFTLWRCRACTKQAFNGWVDEDSIEVFPLQDSNMTKVVNSLTFDTNGQRTTIVAFSTTLLEDDFIGTGRFVGAFLGLAMFKEENNKWILKAFNPAIGYYGMFQTAPHIRKITLGADNYACYIGNYFGGAGGPYDVDGHVFAVTNNTFKEVLTLGDIERSDAPRNIWETDQQTDPTQAGKQFADILITTRGDYLRSNNDSTYGNDTSGVLPQIVPYTKQKDNFDFTIQARYSFTNGAYKLATDSVTISPHKTTDYEKNFKPSW